MDKRGKVAASMRKHREVRRRIEKTIQDIKLSVSEREHNSLQGQMSSELPKNQFETAANNHLDQFTTAKVGNIEVSTIPIPDSDEQNDWHFENHEDDSDDSHVSDTEDSADDDAPTLRRSDLAHWAVSHNIASSALNDLLALLHPSHCNLPKDYRTLLATPLVCEIKRLSNGEYAYFGLEKTLQKFGARMIVDTSDLLHFVLSVDGVQAFHSSGKSFWPIAGYIREDKRRQILLIGMFQGSGKPEPLSDYVKDLTDELNLLRNTGRF